MTEIFLTKLLIFIGLKSWVQVGMAIWNALSDPCIMGKQTSWLVLY